MPLRHWPARAVALGAAQTAALGFGPSAAVDGVSDDAAIADIQVKHDWEMICWRSEWISSAPDGDN